MFGVFTFTLTHFLAKTIFPEGMGGVQNSNWKFRRGGGVILVVKKWKFQGGGGSYVKFPLWCENGYFLELHNVTFYKPFLLENAF